MDTFSHKNAHRLSENMFLYLEKLGSISNIEYMCMTYPSKSIKYTQSLNNKHRCLH